MMSADGGTALPSLVHSGEPGARSGGAWQEVCDGEPAPSSRVFSYIREHGDGRDGYQPPDWLVAGEQGPWQAGRMRYLHTMIRVHDLEAALDFFCTKLGLVETRRRHSERGRFSLVFLATEPGAPELELTHNWDQEEPYGGGRNFGHLAYEVDDIYGICQRLMDHGVTINRPPRDGRMAFVRSPDGISVELLQRGQAQPVCEPWSSMENTGTW